MDGPRIEATARRNHAWRQARTRPEPPPRTPLSQPDYPTALQITHLRATLDLSIDDMARMIHRDHTTILKWERGIHPCSMPLTQMLRHLAPAIRLKKGITS